MAMARSFRDLRTSQEVAAKLNAMINRADDVCKNAPDHDYLHEGPGSYQTDDDP